MSVFYLLPRRLPSVQLYTASLEAAPDETLSLLLRVCFCGPRVDEGRSVGGDNRIFSHFNLLRRRLPVNDLVNPGADLGADFHQVVVHLKSLR